MAYTVVRDNACITSSRTHSTLSLLSDHIEDPVTYNISSVRVSGAVMPWVIDDEGVIIATIPHQQYKMMARIHIANDNASLFQIVGDSGVGQVVGAMHAVFWPRDATGVNQRYLCLNQVVASIIATIGLEPSIEGLRVGGGRIDEDIGAIEAHGGRGH
ncbi:hypothetical protein EON65_25810 [archaeon]|nr:MAG: hypothetical protein EON65_25810 [archaeon]